MMQRITVEPVLNIEVPLKNTINKTLTFNALQASLDKAGWVLLQDVIAKRNAAGVVAYFVRIHEGVTAGTYDVLTNTVEAFEVFRRDIAQSN